MAVKPTPAAPRPILQRRAGAGTATLQRRMKVGAAGDLYEREADRIAERVVGPSALPAAAPPPVISPLSVQRTPDTENARETTTQRSRATGPEDPEQDLPVQRDLDEAMTPRAPPAEDESPVQRAMATGPEAPAEEEPLAPAEPVQRIRATGPEAPSDQAQDVTDLLTAQRDGSGPGAAGGTAPSAIESSIRSMRASPAPGLDSDTRGTMEQRIGVDLGGVRVHTGEGAARAAEGLNARAFTVGKDMFFGRGQYDPGSTAGRRLIAHETAHTIQQAGGTAGVQRIQRAGTAKGNASGSTDKTDETAAKLDRLESKNWMIDFTKPDGLAGTITLPALELPNVAGALKGAAGGQTAPMADAGRALPVAKTPFLLKSVPARGEGKAFETWYNYAKANYADDARKAIEARIKKQRTVEPMKKKDGREVYVLHTGKRPDKSKTMLIGTIDELSQQDGILRPMISPSGADAQLDADHILELQVGGKDAAENMWLLQSKYNRSVGSSIKSKIDKSINDTLGAAERQAKAKKAETVAPIPKDATTVKRQWVIRFKTVRAGKFGTTSVFWTKAQIAKGEQVKHFRAMTPKELVKQGFVFKDGETPKAINVFPGKTGGRAIRFKVSKDGTELQRPSFFFKGLEITANPAFKTPTEAAKNGIMATLDVRRPRPKGKKGKDRQILTGHEHTTVDVRHSEDLGFGGYVTRDSVTAAFNKGFEFKPLSPVSFPNVRITPDGVLFAEGSILSSKALFPQLNVPIILNGEEIYINFPVPTDKLSLGPVRVTDAALQIGVGANGFFISGSAGIAVDQLGSGRLYARTGKEDTVIGGAFAFDFSFVEKAEVEAEYSLAKDTFSAKGTLEVKKDALPGVDGGTITVEATRDSFGVTGTLNLGGVLAGSVITVGYSPKSGLLIEGKDLPLPVEKLPGVSDAKVTVRARRSPDTGEWAVSGAGSAALKAPGASGNLDVTLNGAAVHFAGRIDLAKGPASGFIQITATNMPSDDEGNPIEGGQVGDLQIWGKGSASIAFGKVLTGTAGIEYTRDGRIIISGEIALPPTVDLFDKVEYNKRLLEISPPDFPIWGVKLGPVGVGIFAFVDARVDFLAYVGPGQLRETKVSAVMDLDKPSEATVDGKAQFHVPAYAGFRLDVGGGLKAQAAVAYVKGRVGLDGTLGLGAEAKLDVGVKWNATDGFEAAALAEVKASPKFEVGVNASVSAGVDLYLKSIEKTWGPWRKKLGEFGPGMELSAKFPVKYTEKAGLDLDLNKIEIKKPSLDAKALMKSAFDTLV